MITLELYKRNWNTKYLKYNPNKYILEIEGRVNKFIDIKAYGYGKREGSKKSYGLFDSLSIRTSKIPEWVSKSDIEIWD